EGAAAATSAGTVASPRLSQASLLACSSLCVDADLSRTSIHPRYRVPASGPWSLHCPNDILYRGFQWGKHPSRKARGCRRSSCWQSMATLHLSATYCAGHQFGLPVARSEALLCCCVAAVPASYDYQTDSYQRSDTWQRRL